MSAGIATAAQLDGGIQHSEVGGVTALPGWRLPYGQSISTPSARRDREFASLCDAVRELACGRSEADIHHDVSDEWGACTIAEVRRAIADLARGGDLVRDGEGWVRG